MSRVMSRMQYLCLGLTLLLCGACTMGPDPGQRPVSAADEAAGFVHVPEVPSVSSEARVDHWWRGFADPVTDELVEQALLHNTDLRAAAARVLEADAGLAAARGQRWPQAELSVSGNRTKSSFVLPSVGRVGIYSTTYAADLNVSYQVDLFGRLARNQQAAWSELLATEANRQALTHAIIAQVVRARVQVATLQRQLALAENTAESWQTTFSLVKSRYQLGLVDAEEMHLTRQSMAAAEAALPELRRTLAQSHHALDLLVGRQPGSGDELPPTLPPVAELAPVPAGVPAALLDRRPDLVEARLRFSAATARVGVAIAGLYPSLSLTASGGSRSDSLADLVSSDGLVYSAIANLLTPVFSGGRLRAEVRAARARAEQAAAGYAGAVLTAMREVEDALVAETSLREQLDLLEIRLDSATAAEQLSRSRYHAGTGNLLQLLTADRARSTAESGLITARSEQWQARVALLLALGGDWLGEAIVAPDPDATNPDATNPDATNPDATNPDAIDPDTRA